MNYGIVSLMIIRWAFRVGVAILAALAMSCQSVKIPPGTITSEIYDPQPERPLASQQAELLDYEELVVLLKQKDVPTQAADKAQKLFRTPFVDNGEYERKGLPSPTQHPELGPAIRVTSWNIEKSIYVKEVAEGLRSESRFREHLKEEVNKNRRVLEDTLRQRNDLAHSDILLLQEMDIGHPRSDYLFAADYLAKALGMNYAYAPQQLEIDPVYLGQEDVDFGNKALIDEAYRVEVSDQHKYHGVFGVAVLSRYPIKKVQAFQLKTQTYDWYEGEIERPDFVENGRRWGARFFFEVEPVREVKYGGRGFTRVDLHVPNVPHETVSVINVHLEIKSTPEKRTMQIREILQYIKGISNPVILAGDFNSAATDVSSTSLYRFTQSKLSDPTTLFSFGLWLANITGVNQVRGLLNATKNYQDPLAWDVPVLFTNKTKDLFNEIERFRFDDGGAFDFRGDAQRSVRGIEGVLSNSNQHSRFKGYTQTFKLPRPIGPLGRERLDWVFVKSFLTHPQDSDGTYRLAPHYGETLSLINESVTQPYSDHHPITTILPLKDPENSYSLHALSR